LSESRRYAARLTYHGAAYAGFQRQVDDQPTVQGIVEAALYGITGKAASILGAGRTDSGVHASGQVIAFDLNWRHSDNDLLNAINAKLPSDVAVKKIMPVAVDFHPRFDAKQRSYLYRILIAPVRDPLRQQQVWHRRTPLDITAMQTAAALLVGTHDFASFGQPPQGENTVRHVYELKVKPHDDELHVIMSANAFLQRMVRSIVGTLVDVGRGKLTVNDFEKAFTALNRAQAGPSAPANGLVLTRVVYMTSVDQLFETLQVDSHNLA
jgi:tRNA pseudouridine38-40 synthase